jgi:hypothetical protein
MAEETKPTAEKPPKATAPKKEKPPTVEEKPFTEFIDQHFTPALQKAVSDQGVTDLELKFNQSQLPMVGAGPGDQYWQVIGQMEKGKKQFNIYFLDQDIQGKKAFSYSTNGSQPSTIESFMIDERKVTLDLMVLYTLQRLRGQKWLAGN